MYINVLSCATIRYHVLSYGTMYEKYNHVLSYIFHIIICCYMFYFFKNTYWVIIIIFIIIIIVIIIIISRSLSSTKHLAEQMSNWLEMCVVYWIPKHPVGVGTEPRIDVDGSGAIESEEFIVPLSRWATWLSCPH